MATPSFREALAFCHTFRSLNPVLLVLDSHPQATLDGSCTVGLQAMLTSVKDSLFLNE